MTMAWAPREQRTAGRDRPRRESQTERPLRAACRRAITSSFSLKRTGSRFSVAEAISAERTQKPSTLERSKKRRTSIGATTSWRQRAARAPPRAAGDVRTTGRKTGRRRIAPARGPRRRQDGQEWFPDRCSRGYWVRVPSVGHVKLLGETVCNGAPLLITPAAYRHQTAQPQPMNHRCDAGATQARIRRRGAR